MPVKYKLFFVQTSVARPEPVSARSHAIEFREVACLRGRTWSVEGPLPTNGQRAGGAPRCISLAPMHMYMHVDVPIHGHAACEAMATILRTASFR